MRKYSGISRNRRGAVVVSAREPARANLCGCTAGELGDEKAVFATVESANVVPARARIGGTVVQLAVRQGDRGGAGTAGRNRRRQKVCAAN